MGVKSQLLQVLVAADQLGNTLLLGYADETISARAWRCRDKKRWAIARRVIDFFARPWMRDHCRQSYEAEILRRQLPPAYRTTQMY